MPLYEYECPNCGNIVEMNLPLERYNTIILCTRSNCGGPMRKIFTKLTTCWKDRDRKWGTSFYRKGKEK